MTLEGLIAALDDRSRHILDHRFGPAARPARSLRLIAADLAISAERVRQIERKLLADLARRMPGEMCARLIDTRSGDAWHRISHGENYLRRRDLIQRQARLPSDFRLLLATAGLSVKDWLGTVCQPIGDGWAGLDVSPARIAEIARHIEQRLVRRRTAAIGHIGEGLAIEDIRIAAALILDLPMRNGRIGWQWPGQGLRITAASGRAGRYP